MKKWVSVLFSILLFLELTFFVLVFNATSFFTNSFIVDKIEHMKFDELYPNSDTEIEEMTQEIYDTFSLYGIEKEKVDQVLTEDIKKKFIAEISSDVIEYIAFERTTKLLDKSYLEDYISGKTDEIIENSNLSKKNQKELKQKLEVKINDLVKKLPTKDTVDYYINQDLLNIIRILFAEQFQILFLVLLILTIVLLIYFHYNRKKYLLYICIPTLFTGLILTFSGFTIDQLFQNLFVEKSILIIALISEFFEVFVSKLILNGLVIFIFSVVGILLYFETNKKGGKKYENRIRF